MHAVSDVKYAFCAFVVWDPMMLMAMAFQMYLDDAVDEAKSRWISDAVVNCMRRHGGRWRQPPMVAQDEHSRTSIGRRLPVPMGTHRVLCRTVCGVEESGALVLYCLLRLAVLFPADHRMHTEDGA